MTSKVKPFALLVKPAGAACNLACGYCFYLDKSSLNPGTPAVMPAATLERVLENYFSLPFDGYAVAFQGGEPLLAGIDYFRRAAAISARHPQLRGRIDFSVQTNATLITPEYADFFSKEKWLLGVSIDGDAAAHDFYRKTPSGKGSFEAAMAGKALLDKARCEYNILATVTDANSSDPARLYRTLKKIAGTPFLQFTHCLEKLSFPAWDRFLCAVADAWLADGDMGRIFVRNIESALAYAMYGMAQDCIYAPKCGGYYVVEKIGDVYPCDFAVSPHTLLGNAATDRWEDIVSSEKAVKFAERKCPRHASYSPTPLFDAKIAREIIPAISR